MRAGVVGIAALALFTAGGASADIANPIQEKDVVSGKVKFDPQLGYIFSQGPDRDRGIFLRVPNDQDIVGYRQRLNERLADLEKIYAKKVIQFQADVSQAKLTKALPPPEPKEPTIADVALSPIETENFVQFGPNFVYSKSNATFSYLTAVKPGSYIWYGPVDGSPESGSGFCFCMGSVSFVVKAGMITDIGNYLNAAPQVESQTPSERIEDFRNFFALPSSSQPVRFGLPDSLKGWPSEHAEFRASGKMNNYFGLMITRLAPIPGVLAYRRDVVIDARTGIEL